MRDHEQNRPNEIITRDAHWSEKSPDYRWRDRKFRHAVVIDIGRLASRAYALLAKSSTFEPIRPVIKSVRPRKRLLRYRNPLMAIHTLLSHTVDVIVLDGASKQFAIGKRGRLYWRRDLVVDDRPEPIWFSLANLEDSNLTNDQLRSLRDALEKIVLAE